MVKHGFLKLNCYFLTDLQKNLEMEKRKFEKVKETLTKTEEELKDLKKVCVFLSDPTVHWVLSFTFYSAVAGQLGDKIKRQKKKNCNACR